MHTPLFDSWRDSVWEQIRPDEGESHLQRWLEGRSLPRIDSYTEGHSWLLEAVKTEPRLGDDLARVAAVLLHRQAAGKLKSRNPQRLLSNLLYLAAGLSRPAILWEPVYNVYRSEAVPARNAADDSGLYRGVALVMALRAALIFNQADHSLYETWMRMLQGRPHPYLRGKPMDGLEGIVGLPGGPSWKELGYALACVAVAIHENRERGPQFANLLEVVSDVLPRYKGEFREMAEKCDWPEWTFELVGATFEIQGVVCQPGAGTRVTRYGQEIEVTVEEAKYTDRSFAAAVGSMRDDFMRFPHLDTRHLENEIEALPSALTR